MPVYLHTSLQVIWKYSMRAHLLDMIGQHLGNLPAQLSANPCTLYEYWCVALLDKAGPLY